MKSAVVAALFLCLLVLAASAEPANANLEKIFRDPPKAARPWVFWYWMNGAVSREGITADLESMEKAGIAGAYLFTVGTPKNNAEFAPLAKPLTAEWWALVRHAASEADRLNLALGLAVGDGFATAGGPWITPDLAMQKLVWSETVVDAADPKSLDAPLPQPPTNENFYRDVGVVAVPLREAFEETNSITESVDVTSSWPDLNATFLPRGGEGEKQLRTDKPGWIQYAFSKSFTARSLVVRQWPRNYGGVYQATRLKIQASDDGETFREVTRLSPPRHGWQDWDADYTFALPTTTARYFRFVYDPAGSDNGAEDFDGAKWKTRLTLRGLILSSADRIDGYEGKSAAVWRQPSLSGNSPVSADGVSPARVMDLTAKMSREGRVIWRPVSGKWKILRFGYTPTGHQNETATAARGLECDKLNSKAVRVQFDHWFAEATRQLGPELSSRTLKIFHVDSWEAGSQNWTPAFREEFRKRRGYDLLPMLPAMAGVPVGKEAESEAFLADIRRTVADLTRENFFGTLRRLAHEHGCEFSAEPTAPTMSGDSMEALSEVDIPMGEFWLRSPTHDKPTDMADAISAAHVYGKPIVQAESFTELRLQWDEHPGMLKPLADHEFALGLNRVVLHVFVHNPWLDRKPGMTLNGVGTYFQRDQTWWPKAKAWTDYLARCSALLQVGRPVADVAYFVGEDLPARAVIPERRSSPLPDGYAADSINTDALLNLAHLKESALTLPSGMRYRALVLPKTSSASSPTLVAKLREFPSVVIEPGQSVAAHLKSQGIAADLLTKEEDGTAAKHLEWTHRSAPEAEIYFLSNQDSRARTLRFSFRQAEGVPEIWLPVTGEISTANHFTRQSGRTDLSLEFDGFGSMFVVFRSGRTDEKLSRVQPNSRLRETAQLQGPWSVTFSPELGGPREQLTFRDLVDWSKREEPGIKYYSGTAVYHQEFSFHELPLGHRVWLDLGSVANLAHVRLNGVDCGTVWTPPCRVEISHALRAGTNRLEVSVTNTWNNRLVGDQVAPPATGPITWTTAPARPNPELLPGGLLGPVRLLEAP